MMRWLLLFIAFPLLSHAAVERLVTLGGDVTEIVYALDAEQSLVARDSPRRRKSCRTSATCDS